MHKKVMALLVMMVFVCCITFAVCGTCADKGSASGKEASAAVKVNNAVCPVTGQAVNMKDPVTIEYKGKIYNLCCPDCIKEFNSDPGKYSAKVK